MLRGRTDRETCDLNGWTVGTRLVGDEGYGPTVIEITGLGEFRVLAKTISVNGNPRASAWEATWTLTCRDWTEVPTCP